jgi:glycosyltransferase involved in cell wall biosynthesis
MSAALTIGIAFHDEEDRLEGAIQSILAQSFDDFELLLVDDGSADRSLAIARSFDDPRISVFTDGRRLRLGARLNQIVSRARGAFIARMDADDVSHPDRLRRQMEHLEREPECVAVGTWAAIVDDRGEPFGTIEAPGLRPGGARIDGPPIPHATMVARADWLRRYPYDSSLARAEDRDLWCRVAGTSRIDVIEDVLYVVHASATRATFLEDYLDGQADLRRVLVRYGRDAPARTARAVAASFAKSGVMILANRMGQAPRLVRRRGRAPTAAERMRVEEALSAARMDRGRSASRSIGSRP